MSTLPAPTTPKRQTKKQSLTPMTYQDSYSFTTQRLSEESTRTSGTEITVPSANDSGVINNTNHNLFQTNNNYQYPPQPMETDPRLPQRHHRRESSLLAHLDLDEEETRAWKAVASPKTPRPKVAHHAHSVPAHCFPSLRGKIPTPTSPVPSFEMEKIRQLERPEVRRERSEMRYSVYVSDKDFDVPKGGWMNKLRHGHSNSIGDMFGLSKKQKEHKSNKSVSEVQ